MASGRFVKSRPLILCRVLREVRRRFGVRCGHTQEAAISTVTIVALVIWNGLLLAVLIALVIRWKQVLHWITQSDGEDRNEWERSAADGCSAFLAEHPELYER